MNFANLSHLWLMLIVPLACAVGVYRARERSRRLRLFADSQLLPDLGVSEANMARVDRRYLLFLLFASASLTAAALRPQWGFEWKETKRVGSDIVFAIDVSDSMLAKDASPSRLEQARREIFDLLSLFQGDRVALVSFSGVAFIETPLTLDYGAFRQFLENLDPSDIPVKGSNIELALRKSLEALGIKDGDVQPRKSAAIILITDGEELDGDLSRIAAVADKSQVRIFVMGVGTEEGAPIPMPGGYKRDKEGKLVISRMKASVLEEVARQTGGTYVRSISSAQDSAALYVKGIRRSVGTSEFEAKDLKRWREYYQFPLLLCLFALLFGPWSSGPRLRRRIAASVAATLLLPALVRAQPVEELGKTGVKALELGAFEEAKQRFEEAAASAAADYRVLQGLGASYYRLGQFDSAEEAFARGVAAAETDTQKAHSLYNMGNSLVQAKKYAEAIKAYESSLKAAPNDQQTKDNLEYAKRLLEEQKKKQDDQKKEQQSKDPQKQDQQEQKDQQNQAQDEQNQQQSQQEQQQPQDGEQNEDGAQQSSPSNDEAEPSPSPSPSQGDKSGDEKQQDGNEGESETPKDGPTASPTPDPSPGESGEEPEDEDPNGRPPAAEGDEAKERNEQRLETLLGSVQEKEGARSEYRLKKAMQQLKAEKRKPPEKDW